MSGAVADVARYVDAQACALTEAANARRAFGMGHPLTHAAAHTLLERCQDDAPSCAKPEIEQ